MARGGRGPGGSDAGRAMRLRRALGSVRLAAWLIAALAGLSVLSVVFPQSPTLGSETVAEWRAAQPWIAGPAIALGLTRVFYSWPYYIVSLLLTANLTVCTVDRMASRRRGGVPALGPVASDAIETPLGVAQDTVADVLRCRMRGFEVRTVPGGAICRSGRTGFAGSVCMHLGLIVMVIAGVVTGLTRFEGLLLLTEGFETKDVPSSYAEAPRTPLVGRPYTGATIALDRMDFEYAGPTITESRAYVTVEEGGTRRERVVRVNHPLRVGTKSFLLKESGLAAGLQVTDPSGTVLPAAMVNLGGYTPEGSKDDAEFGRLRLGLLAIPDGDVPAGHVAAERLVLVKPAVIVSATVAGQAALDPVLVFPGGSANAGGWRVDVLEVRRWTSFNARVDLGIYVAYIGFLLATGGFVLRLMDPDRLVRVAFENGTAKVWARARWGPTLARPAAESAARALGREREERG